MSRWVGLWLGAWEGAESPSESDTALEVLGSGIALFGAEVIQGEIAPPAPPQIGGGGRRRQGPFQSVYIPPPDAVVVLAGFKAVGRGTAVLQPQAGLAVDSAALFAGRSSARLSAGLSVSAAAEASGGSAIEAAATLPAALLAAMECGGKSGARFAPKVSARRDIAPKRRELELADDELAAVLILLAA